MHKKPSKGETFMEPNQARIIIGADHAAYPLKEHIKSFLQEKKQMVVTDAGVHTTESVDYPEYGKYVASAVSSGEFARGILLCGSGLGMSMVANRFDHVRAALCNDLFSAEMSRKHNDANILVLGGRVIGDVLAEEIVSRWLDTPFEGGRHQRRLDQFDQMCRLGLNGSGD
jgi:ribose 5-phosphate isomerase B